MSEQIAAISQVIAALPPGLTADEIAHRVWAVVQTSAAPVVSAPSINIPQILTADQKAMIAQCREEGSVSLGQGDARASLAAELAMMGYLVPAASGLDYTLWRLTALGMQA